MLSNQSHMLKKAYMHQYASIVLVLADPALCAGQLGLSTCTSRTYHTPLHIIIPIAHQLGLSIGRICLFLWATYSLQIEFSTSSRSNLFDTMKPKQFVLFTYIHTFKLYSQCVIMHTSFVIFPNQTTAPLPRLAPRYVEPSRNID